jgi:A1 cistron-splicing factor AAR2
MASPSKHDESSAADEPDRRSSMETDDAFHVVLPNVSSPTTSAALASSESGHRSDPTFVQNQIALQRAPSIAQTHKSSLSHKPSVKSNVSFDLGAGQSDSADGQANGDTGSTRNRGDSTSSVTEAVKNHSLTKSSSTSARSIKSVQSVTALGVHPIGSLHVHSDEDNQRRPSPDCLLSGDVVVVTGMPAGSIFGFDTVSFTLGRESHFAGLRDLPSGPHFIYGGSSSELSTRTGFWIMSQRRASGEHGEIYVKRWDSYSETLEDELSVAEIMIQHENVPSAFNSFMPYTTKAATLTNSSSASTEMQPPPKDDGINDPNIWHRLTFAIKGAMLTRITNQAWNKWQVSSTSDSKSMVIHHSGAKTQSLVGMTSDRSVGVDGKESVLRFAFSRTGVTYSPEVIGRARTEQAMDTSAHIVAVINNMCTYEDPDEVVGELQFCYITGVLLGNIACQEQWAHIVKVIFKAFNLAMDMPVLFRNLIETVHSQLIYDEEGVEGSIFDHDAYLQDELKVLLTVFKSRLNEQLLSKGADLTDDQSQVGKSFEALESWLWKWGWDLRGNYLRSGKIQLEDGEFVDAELTEFEAEDERGEFHDPQGLSICQTPGAKQSAR